MKFEITSADDRHFYLLKFYEIFPHQNEPFVPRHKSMKLEKDFRDSSVTHAKY